MKRTPSAGEDPTNIDAALKSLEVPIARLKPWQANYRRGDIGAVSESLRAFGQKKPVVVQRSNMTVVAGNHVLQAALALGWRRLAAVVSEMDDVMAARYAIADNRTSDLAANDEPVLAELLKALVLPDGALTGASGLEGTGYDLEALDELLDGIRRHQASSTIVEVAAPALPKKARSRIGQTYLLGRHRLLCGDARDAAAVARLFGAEKARLFCTDPPYGVAYNTTKNGIPRPGFRNQKERWGGDLIGDDLDGSALQGFLEAAFRAALPVLDRAAWYLWHAHLTQGFFAAAAAAADVLLHRQIIWRKRHLVLTRSGQYHWQHEPAFYGWVRGQAPRWLGGKSQTSVWELEAEAQGPGGRLHPTQKPVALFERPIANHLRPNEIAYDPFAGSGSQLICAEQMERRCYAIEIDPRWCDVIRQRYADLVQR